MQPRQGGGGSDYGIAAALSGFFRAVLHFAAPALIIVLKDILRPAAGSVKQMTIFPSKEHIIWNYM